MVSAVVDVQASAKVDFANKSLVLAIVHVSVVVVNPGVLLDVDGIDEG
jgi:hypothetical protein